MKTLFNRGLTLLCSILLLVTGFLLGWASVRPADFGTRPETGVRKALDRFEAAVSEMSKGQSEDARERLALRGRELTTALVQWGELDVHWRRIAEGRASDPAVIGNSLVSRLSRQLEDFDTRQGDLLALQYLTADLEYAVTFGLSGLQKAPADIAEAIDRDGRDAYTRPTAVARIQREKRDYEARSEVARKRVEYKKSSD